MKLKIGDFARIGRLTIQTRHNDEESGLLKPGHPTNMIPIRDNGAMLIRAEMNARIRGSITGNHIMIRPFAKKRPG
ncbi:MAG TPA: hypothetical protein VFQ13_24220 [Anaerolineales bacterium]|nr:hypothetical protein [Anaerolineales bacterium]